MFCAPQVRVRPRVDGGRLQGARVQPGLRRARPLREQRLRLPGRVGRAILPRQGLRPEVLHARTGEICIACWADIDIWRFCG